MHWVWSLIRSASIAALLLVAWEEPAWGQSAWWLIGTWEGVHSRGKGPDRDKTRFEFFEEGGRTKWRLTAEPVSGARSGSIGASGTVMGTFGSTIILEGRIEQSIDRALVGQPLRYSLKSEAGTLQGTAVGPDGTVIANLALRRAPRPWKRSSGMRDPIARRGAHDRSRS